MFREVVDIERAFASAGANLLEIKSPRRKEFFAESIESEQRLSVEEPRQLSPVQPNCRDWIEVAPVVGDLRAAHSLHPHCEVEGCGADRIGMIEFEPSFIEPDLQHPRLKGDLESAPRQH